MSSDQKRLMNRAAPFDEKADDLAPPKLGQQYIQSDMVVSIGGETQYLDLRGLQDFRPVLRRILARDYNGRNLASGLDQTRIHGQAQCRVKNDA